LDDCNSIHHKPGQTGEERSTAMLEPSTKKKKTMRNQGAALETSVLKHFSFQRFLHLRNLQKLIKTCKTQETRKFGNLCPNSQKPIFDLP